MEVMLHTFLTLGLDGG